jgi:hypothetical protein
MKLTLYIYVFIIIADDELRDCTKRTMSIPYSLRMIHGAFFYIWISALFNSTQLVWSMMFGTLHILVIS